MSGKPESGGAMRQSSPAIDISKVIITGGRETGGVQSYAETLAHGFVQLGIPAEVIPPQQIYKRWRVLRDRSILKILSTTAVYAAPLANRTICMAHGLPRADAQGWAVTLGVLASLKISAKLRKPCLVAVSYYTSSTLKALYNIEAAAVIHNPLKPMFFTAAQERRERTYITYVGRLHPAKNIDRLLPAMQEFLIEVPELRICVVGDGPLGSSLRARFSQDSRIEFAGRLDDRAMRDVLAKSKVFISGNEVEGFGIAYLEALSQGCSVVMPASGGGLEIAPELIGSQVQLMPLSFDVDGIKGTIREALKYCGSPVSLRDYEAVHVAGKYLSIGAGIS